MNNIILAMSKKLKIVEGYVNVSKETVTDIGSGKEVPSCVYGVYVKLGNGKYYEIDWWASRDGGGLTIDEISKEEFEE